MKNVELKSCTPVKNKEGTIKGTVCIAPSKDLEKNDIMFMRAEGKTNSFRSITELMNCLEKENIPFEERTRVMEFSANRLRALELNGMQRYSVFNKTDGIFASEEEFKSEKDAQKFIDDFPKRFEHQGYYLTSDRIKINPNEVELEIQKT